MSNATHNALLTTMSIVSAAYAVALLVAPVQFANVFGITADAPAAWFERLLGASALGFAAIALFARRVDNLESRRALDAGLLVAWTATLGITMWALYLQVMNPLGWIHVVVDASFAVSFFWFLAAEDRSTDADSPHTA